MNLELKHHIMESNNQLSFPPIEAQQMAFGNIKQFVIIAHLRIVNCAFNLLRHFRR